MNSMLDNPLLASRYFFPRPGSLKDPFVVQVDGAELHCSYHDPHPEGFTLVFFHGNGEIVADYEGPFVDMMSRAGLNIVMVSYRGYGDSTGVPTLARMLDDVSAVVKALGLPEEKLIFYGRSLGSIYAIHGASLFPKAAGLIIESGIADPEERIRLRITPEELGCSDQALSEEIGRYFDHKEKLSAYSGPVLILHTRHDGILDISHAERMHQWCLGKGSLVIFEAGTHNTILSVNGPRYLHELTTFTEGLR